MIKVESGIAITPAHPANPNRITPALRNLIERYAEAYKRVYGIRPEVKWENPWFKIAGSSARVSRSRLLELTRQLEYRIG